MAPCTYLHLTVRFISACSRLLARGLAAGLADAPYLKQIFSVVSLCYGSRQCRCVVEPQMPMPQPVARSGFDYAKWDRLEISDDEAGICLSAAGVFVPVPCQTTFHPNLDKGLNIRVNRITRERKEDEIDEDARSQVGSTEGERDAT